MIGPGYLEAMGVEVEEDEGVPPDEARLVNSSQLGALLAAGHSLGDAIRRSTVAFRDLATTLQPPEGWSAYSAGERERQIDASRARARRPAAITQRSRRSLHRR